MAKGLGCIEAAPTGECRGEGVSVLDIVSGDAAAVKELAGIATAEPVLTCKNLPFGGGG